MAVWLWQKLQRIYICPRMDPQSAHLWWPAVAKLQAASMPIALAAAPWDRQMDRPWYRLMFLWGGAHNPSYQLHINAHN